MNIALGRLPPRERKVAELIGEGADYREIARALGITVGTARIYGHRVIRTFNAKNRQEVALAMQRERMLALMIEPELVSVLERIADLSVEERAPRLLDVSSKEIRAARRHLSELTSDGDSVGH